MLIRSQNKWTIIDCKNIFGYYSNIQKKYVIATNNNTDIILGVYSSEKQALEILDLIDKRYEYQYLRTNNYTGRPFQMPQDRGDIK